MIEFQFLNFSLTPTDSKAISLMMMTTSIICDHNTIAPSCLTFSKITISTMMMAMMIHYARTLQSTPLVPTSSNRFNSSNISGDGDDNDGRDWILSQLTIKLQLIRKKQYRR